MEVGLRFLVFLQLLLRLISAPFYLVWTWRNKPRARLPPIGNPLLNLSITQLAARIRSRQVTSEEVVRAFVERIRQVDPQLNAVVEDRFEAALEEARAVDRLVAEGRLSPQQILEQTPFLGVPFTVKESCSLKGLSYCVGSLPRRGEKADEDGEAVRLLRKAGAIPLAVTTTPELCLSWETNNLVTGRTCNPFDFLRSSGGSSGGEAALIGSGASLLGVASDIAGSIRIPAHFTGIFGHKPTPGYVSVDGHYPNSDEPEFRKYLVIGPLTRYAVDLRPALKVMAGERAGPLRLDEPVNLSDLKVFYKEDAGPSLVMVSVEEEIKQRLKLATAYLHNKFQIPVKEGNFPELSDSLELSTTVFFAMQSIDKILRISGNSKKEGNLILEIAKSLLGISQFSLPALAFMWLYKVHVLIPRNKFPEYRRQMETLRTKFQEVLGDNGVFLYPTYPRDANFHNQVYTKTSGVAYTMIFNILGMPSTHVPLGLNGAGLPIGIQILAAPHNDRLCIAVAQELEKGFGGWIPPPS